MSTSKTAQGPRRLISQTTHDNGRVEDLLRPDGDIQMLCGFRAHSDATDFRQVEIYSRKWPITPEALRSLESRDAKRSLGTLGRLPVEVRYMIYDFVSEPRTYEIRLHSLIMVPLVPFIYMPMKTLAHACRDMREYCMRNYRLLWYKATAPKRAAMSRQFTDNEGSGYQSSKWFYDARRDVINLHGKTVCTFEVFESAKIEWSEDFKVPVSTSSITWIPAPQAKPKVSDLVARKVPANTTPGDSSRDNHQVHTVFSPRRSGLLQTTWLEEEG
ncbi:hypothetical protein GGR57DRAFT_520579 [Xylariaceae sp. FL1272]|nr:hypothetical protein GGR57DRAFT_520579 [Xylariaceae sp. FL1272]